MIGIPEPCALTVSGLAKVAIFTTNFDAENQTLINHKCVCGALNRHFCQTRVIASASFFQFVHLLFKFTIKNISPPNESPIPVKKQIVLNGCPMVVVKPKPHNNQPTIIEVINNITLMFFVIV